MYDNKIVWTVFSFKPFKSAGPDGIVLPWLKSILYHCLKLNYISYKWRQVKVVFMPKAGKKTSHSSPKHFRPISLSSFLLKTLERLKELNLKSIIKPNMSSKAHRNSSSLSGIPDRKILIYYRICIMCLI